MHPIQDGWQKCTVVEATHAVSITGVVMEMAQDKLSCVTKSGVDVYEDSFDDLGITPIRKIDDSEPDSSNVKIAPGWEKCNFKETDVFHTGKLPHNINTLEKIDNCICWGASLIHKDDFDDFGITPVRKVAGTPENHWVYQNSEWILYAGPRQVRRAIITMKSDEDGFAGYSIMVFPPCKDPSYHFSHEIPEAKSIAEHFWKVDELTP